MQPSAQRAIDILSKIDSELGKEPLAYWVIPNTILTMSGARAFCDGVFWSDASELLSKWDVEIKSSVEVIKKDAKLTSSNTGVESVRDNETYASYGLIFSDGLDHSLNTTKLLTGHNLGISSQSKTFEEVNNLIKDNLRAQSRFDNYSDDDITDIVYGILLGYPDEAILGTVELWDSTDPFAEKLIDADIRGANYYICPQPVYSYPRHLVSDPKINKHEKMWSKILEDYYSSDFHKSLENNPDFNRKLEEIGSK